MSEFAEQRGVNFYSYKKVTYRQTKQVTPQIITIYIPTARELTQTTSCEPRPRVMGSHFMAVTDVENSWNYVRIQVNINTLGTIFVYPLHLCTYLLTIGFYK